MPLLIAQFSADAGITTTTRSGRVEVNGHLIDVYLEDDAPDPATRIQRIATGAAIFNLLRFGDRPGAATR
jgi:hypothetical protein